MKKNYKITVSYDGTRYSGWQNQGNTGETIQAKLENVLSRFANEHIDVIGAGRTDAGVHALGMVANFHLPGETAPPEPEEVLSYLNKYLPDDICVTEIKEASERFHSRYNAAGKTYKYTCFIAGENNSKPIFDRNYVHILDSMPDVPAMKQAAADLVGEHDFKSFCANPRFSKSSVRTINDIKITVNGSRLIFTYQADGFLQNMVRILTGTLLEVGYKQRACDSMPDILAARDRKAAGYMAPAKGLCLVKVEY